jgi:hypothetical protein
MRGKLWMAVRQFFGYEPPCAHRWRPIVAQLVGWNESKPARQCAICKEWQPLSDEQFYAQFGESFYRYAKRPEVR